MYDTNNVFAKILRKEMPCKKVYEDDFALIFHDINPSAPIHLLAIPKGEFKSFADFTENATDKEMKGFYDAISIVTKQIGVHEDGYRIITNIGKNGGQIVDHLHMHILAGKQLGALVQDS